MTAASPSVEIKSRDYWFKIVEFLQQNWALIEHQEADVVVWFIDDASGVFDKMEFTTPIQSEEALQRNGFRRYADDLESQEFIATPKPPFYPSAHPNGRIYSSGRYWK